MTRRTSRLAALFGVLVVATALVGCAGRQPDIAAATVFAVGDCVQIPAGPTPAPEPARASAVACTADPSYTVGATTNADRRRPSVARAARHEKSTGNAPPLTVRHQLATQLCITVTTGQGYAPRLTSAGV